MPRLPKRCKGFLAAHARLTELVRFALTGGVCFLIEYAALLLLVESCGVPVLWATAIAFLISVIFNYLLCVVWVFKGAKDSSRQAKASFLLTSLIGFGLNQLFMTVLCALLGEKTLLFTLFGHDVTMYMLNKIITTVLVMVWNYITKRMILTKKAK